MFRDQLVNLNRTHSPTSLVQTDDVEAFARHRRVCYSPAISGFYCPGWTKGRPFRQDVLRQPEPVKKRMRNHYRAWLNHVFEQSYMTIEGGSAMDELILVRKIEKFLICEVGLPDDRQFDDWINLFTEDGYY